VVLAHCESTTLIVEIVMNGVPVAMRVWQGRTDGDIPLAFLVPRVWPLYQQDTPEFSEEMQYHAAPWPETQAYIAAKYYL
jgi:hypothetical protein